jgi:excisionase family DNA binding protein
MCPSSPAETLAALVANAAPSELPALAAELARALGHVLARATHPPPMPRLLAVEGSPGPLLTVEEAAERLGVAPSWLYRHAKTLPFTRKLGHRTLRFEAIGVNRWIANRTR